MKVNMLEAKSQLSRLVKEALNGREVVIASNGEPMVKLVPVARKGGLSRRGRLKKFAGDIDAAFTPAVEAAVARTFQGKP
ncbi:MAG: type II toxin-antitoxin system prevent-host-death family antitoxin [Acidobacteria bacterium]|nr:type II toxin-antitoxin system prevent-host-death family antitoxin [Acidobacteriota bacterium]